MVFKLAPLVICFIASVAAQVIDLSGSGWTLRNSNGSIKVPATVPSHAYLDLFQAGVIPDPVYGFNDDLNFWVERDNWTYTSPSFPSLKPYSSQSSQRTFLGFDGLDTFARITLCGKEVANTKNQFRQYLFDVTDVLNSCENDPQVAINFGSATKITHHVSNETNDGLISFATSCNDSNELGCKVFARKQQNDFGWDWSPSVVPAGPWRKIYAADINTSQPVHISNALIDIYRKGQMNNLPPDQSQPWIFNASLDFVGTLTPGSSMTLTLSDPANPQILRIPLENTNISNSTITGDVTIDPTKVQQWWPNGLGRQVLYNATIDISQGGSTSIASVTRQVGFRTIVLNLNPTSNEQLAQGIAPGANWHFEINGRLMYAKGSNLVPLDVFWPRVNQSKTEHLFQLAKNANMNMLRVWGSGAYLDDYIYDIADRVGILLWSEFQFTDAPYSNATSFLQEYEAEAIYNVRRINHHPSLALWAGGNELESVELTFFYGNGSTPSDVFQKYQQIQEELLINIVYANSHSISYIPSSTYNGYTNLDFSSVRPQTARYHNYSGEGFYYNDTDYYNTDWSAAFDYSSFPVGRFADEFGCISLPSLPTWQEAVPSTDLSVESPSIVHHNRHTVFGQSGDPEVLRRGGIDEMTSAVHMYYPAPNFSDKLANFTAWIYSTQVFQSEFVQHEIAFYRRGSGMPERQLGSLFWMLNDNWAGSTWASVEWNNRPKMLYYVAKDVFSPLIVYAYQDIHTRALDVYVTSDLWQPVSGTVAYQWMDWEGNPLTLSDSSSNTSSNSTPAGSQSSQIGFTVGALNTTRVLSYGNISSALATSRYNASNAVLQLSVTSSDQNYTHSYFFHPEPIKNAPISDPGLRLTHDGTNQFTVAATRGIAAWIWLDTNTNGVSGFWSENGFWLNRGEVKTVEFTVWQDWSGGAWRRSVTARSMYNNIKAPDMP